MQSSGNLSLLVVNTEAGGTGTPFSPPSGFDKSPKAYLDLMRERWVNHVGYRQQMQATADLLYQYHVNLEFSGPYAEQAKGIIHKMAPHRQKQAA